MNEQSGFHNVRKNIHDVISRRAVHPVHPGYADMEAYNDGVITNLYRKMYER